MRVEGGLGIPLPLSITHMKSPELERVCALSTLPVYQPPKEKIHSSKDVTVPNQFQW